MLVFPGGQARTEAEDDTLLGKASFQLRAWCRRRRSSASWKPSLCSGRFERPGRREDGPMVAANFPNAPAN